MATGDPLNLDNLLRFALGMQQVKMQQEQLEQQKALRDAQVASFKAATDEMNFGLKKQKDEYELTQQIRSDAAKARHRQVENELFAEQFPKQGERNMSMDTSFAYDQDPNVLNAEVLGKLGVEGKAAPNSLLLSMNEPANIPQAVGAVTGTALNAAEVKSFSLADMNTMIALEEAMPNLFSKLGRLEAEALQEGIRTGDNSMVVAAILTGIDRGVVSKAALDQLNTLFAAEISEQDSWLRYASQKAMADAQAMGANAQVISAITGRTQALSKNLVDLYNASVNAIDKGALMETLPWIEEAMAKFQVSFDSWQIDTGQMPPGLQSTGQPLMIPGSGGLFGGDTRDTNIGITGMPETEEGLKELIYNNPSFQHIGAALDAGTIGYGQALQEVQRGVDYMTQNQPRPSGISRITPDNVLGLVGQGGGGGAAPAIGGGGSSAGDLLRAWATPGGIKARIQPIIDAAKPGGDTARARQIVSGVGRDSRQYSAGGDEFRTDVGGSGTRQRLVDRMSFVNSQGEALDFEVRETDDGLQIVINDPQGATLTGKTWDEILSVKDPHWTQKAGQAWYQTVMNLRDETLDQVHNVIDAHIPPGLQLGAVKEAAKDGDYAAMWMVKIVGTKLGKEIGLDAREARRIMGIKDVNMRIAAVNEHVEQANRYAISTGLAESPLPPFTNTDTIPDPDSPDIYKRARQQREARDANRIRGRWARDAREATSPVISEYPTSPTFPPTSSTDEPVLPVSMPAAPALPQTSPSPAGLPLQAGNEGTSAGAIIPMLQEASLGGPEQLSMVLGQLKASGALDQVLLGLGMLPRQIMEMDEDAKIAAVMQMLQRVP